MQLDDHFFIKDFNPEYEIEKALILYFQRVFANDNQFQFNEDPKITDLKITNEYPEVSREDPSFVPHIVLSGINARINPNQSFFSNFFEDIEDETGAIVAQTQLYPFAFSVTIFCVASTSSACKDLSMKVTKKLAVDDVYITNNRLRLNFESEIMKGQPALRQQFPSRVYECVVSFAGRMMCIHRREYGDDLNPLTGAKFRNVRVRVKIVKNRAELR